MKYEVGQLIVGTVTSVKPYALFLTFEDSVQGLLHISEISDAYIRDIEKYGSLGDKLRVLVLSIDKTNGFLRVSLKKVPTEEAYSTHSNGRTAPNFNDGDFEPLKEKLPEWIDNALNEIKDGQNND